MRKGDLKIMPGTPDTKPGAGQDARALHQLQIRVAQSVAGGGMGGAEQEVAAGLRIAAIKATSAAMEATKTLVDEGA